MLYLALAGGAVYVNALAAKNGIDGSRDEADGGGRQSVYPVSPGTSGPARSGLTGVVDGQARGGLEAVEDGITLYL